MEGLLAVRYFATTNHVDGNNRVKDVLEATMAMCNCRREVAKQALQALLDDDESAVQMETKCFDDIFEFRSLFVTSTHALSYISQKPNSSRQIVLENTYQRSCRLNFATLR